MLRRTFHKPMFKSMWADICPWQQQNNGGGTMISSHKEENLLLHKNKLAFVKQRGTEQIKRWRWLELRKSPQLPRTCPIHTLKGRKRSKQTGLNCGTDGPLGTLSDRSTTSSNWPWAQNIAATPAESSTGSKWNGLKCLANKTMNGSELTKDYTLLWKTKKTVNSNLVKTVFFMDYSNLPILTILKSTINTIFVRQLDALRIFQFFSRVDSASFVLILVVLPE